MIARFEEYREKPGAKAFAVAMNGAWAQTEAASHTREAVYQVMKRCREYSATCFLYAVGDTIVAGAPTCDIEQVRKWAKEIIDSSPYSTDEKMMTVQVVDFTEKSMLLRVLGKSWDSSNTWNLRCEIREKLIRKFQEAGLPLPEIRIDRVGPAPDNTGTSD